MNTVRRIRGLFQDSPTYGQDRANLFSAITVGAAGLLLNGAVMLMALPLMLDPNDRGFRMLTQNVEFGQLLALILLGGATVFATLLIPLRLVTVFWGPRTGRYFDQIVLSGISPIKFLIGKATSQNLFLGLILFLLVPYFVLALTLGGVNPFVFVAGVFLVWLYCMALALVTLWLSLYFNEALSGLIVAYLAICSCVAGCFPLPVQPFVVTPLPALLQPVYSAIPSNLGWVSPDFFPVFASCAVGMSVLIVVALFGIHLGPIYGIIRDNSTFGEVVRKGDSEKRRRFRMRLHIQRSSEIAFFYENRSDLFRRHEGLFRWGVGLGVLLLLLCVAYGGMAWSFADMVKNWGMNENWWAESLHIMNLMYLGWFLILAALLFSHARNSTYLRIPFVFGKPAEVARLDTIGFVLFAGLATAVAIAFPFWFDVSVAQPLNKTAFPLESRGYRQAVDYQRVAVEGSLCLLTSGIVVYTIHRFVSLFTWLRLTAFAATAAIYGIFVCLMPFLVGMTLSEFGLMARNSLLESIIILGVMLSPAGVLMVLYGEAGGELIGASTPPFYAFHALLFLLTIIAMRKPARRLRESYLSTSSKETN